MNLVSRNKCTGCGNCLISCKLSAISFILDEFNNVYPKIDVNKCVECRQCIKACPVSKGININFPRSCYAAYVNDPKIRKKSASGGVASAIYQYSIKKEMLCVGVAMDANHEAHYSIENSLDGITRFQNSKYTFSFLDNVINIIAKRLQENKHVAFCALPCQVAALKQFLNVNRISDELLLTIELICHGVPSAEYLKEHVKSISGNKPIKSIQFRDYHYGTYKFVFSLCDKDGDYYHKVVESNDNYQIAYHNATFYRPNCYECDYSCPYRVGDITIGDFTGLAKFAPPDFDVKKEIEAGISCILVNTEKGKILIDNMQKCNSISIFERPLEEALNIEPQLQHPSNPSRYRDNFLKLYPHYNFTKTCNTIFRVEKIKRPIVRKIKDIAKKVLRR